MEKIVLAQIDTVAGDIENNKKKIIDYILKAKELTANMIIFPEFALIGYPFCDILTRHKSIITSQIKALDDIVKISTGIAVLVGYVNEKCDSSIAIIQSGKIIDNAVFELNSKRYGVLSGHISTFDVEKLMKRTPDTIINCACITSRCGSEYNQNELFSAIAKKYEVNYIYVNKCGYADNVVHGGGSRIYDKKGNITACAKYFEEDFLVTSELNGEINKVPDGMNRRNNEFTLDYTSDLYRTYKSITLAIKEYFKKNGFSKAVLGLSGGLDSSVSAVLLVDALGKENVYGISMPSEITSNESKSDASILAKNLGIHFFEQPLYCGLNPTKIMLKGLFDKIKAQRNENPTTIENLQARLRATILWSIANEYKGMIPIATSDKSEAYIGYATINGDMSGGFAPIADVTKTKLFALARFLNNIRDTKNVIPNTILEKPPGAELKINPKTGKSVCAEEDNMPYEFLDEIIWLIENRGYGKQDLLGHKFLYETYHQIREQQKSEWVDKFYWKMKNAVYKWHIMPPTVVVDSHSINSVEYRQPIISKVY